MPAAGLGTLSYNDYPFDGASRLKIRDQFEWDDADRTVVGHRLFINVQGTLGSLTVDDLDSQIDNIRYKLSQPGKGLKIINRGFGADLNVNVSSGGLQDLMNGPKPRILTWEPAGGNRAVDFEWECETIIPVCNNQGVYRKHTGPMSLCYEVTYEINERGFTRRSINGFLKIVSNRNGLKVLDVADTYREALQPSVLRGFRRRYRWTNTNDRTQVNFSIDDEQIETKAPFPQHVTDIKGTHRVHWTRNNHAAMIARQTIAMEITLIPLAPQVIGYQIFGNFVKNRIDAASRNRTNVLMDDFDIEEDIFGFTTKYSISYRTLTSLRDILQASQLWLIPTDYIWSAWHTSMTRVQDARGLAGLIYQPSMDAIINPCAQEGGGELTEAVKPFQVTGSLTQPYRALQNPIPTSENSWMQWQNQIMPGKRQPIVRQSTIQAPETNTQTTLWNSTGGFNFPASGGSEDTLIATGVGRYGCVMVGFAERAQYPIPRPGLTSVGNQRAIEKEVKFASRCVGNYFGVPVYRAAWRISYELSNSPGNVSQLGNIQQGVNTDGSLRPGS